MWFAKYLAKTSTLAYYAEKLGKLTSKVGRDKKTCMLNLFPDFLKLLSITMGSHLQFGLNISDINKIVNSGLAGQATGFVYEGEKRFEMVVRLDGEQRKNIDDVRNLLILRPMVLKFH